MDDYVSRMPADRRPADIETQKQRRP